MHPLKEAIFEKGLSVAEFCEKTGLTTSCLYRIFRGESKQLQQATLWCIAKVLEIPIKEVYRMVNDNDN